MKKILALAGLAALATGCLATGRVTASDVTFTSQFLDQSGRNVICDNRNTDVEISFRYSEAQPGALVKWQTRLFGALNPETEYPVGELTRSSPGVLDDGSRITYTVGIAPKQAPLRDTVRPQAVIVVPVVIPDDPTPLGATRLSLRIFDDAGVNVEAFLGNQIRVVDNCPN
jgi:hypothetical protein